MVLLTLGNLHNPSFATTFHCNSSSHNFVKFLPPHVHCLVVHLQQIQHFALEESRLWWAKITFPFHSKMNAAANDDTFKQEDFRVDPSDAFGDSDDDTPY
mgnify:CR=1 FL=1